MTASHCVFQAATDGATRAVHAAGARQPPSAPSSASIVSRASLNLRNWILLGASYVFYGAWDWRFLGLLMGSTLVDWVVGRLLGRTDDPRQRRRLLTLSMVTNLTVLGFFWFAFARGRLLRH